MAIAEAMCGICGIIGVEPPEVAQAALRRMLERLAHRGPDDEGLLLRGRVAAGMRRLSIIDIPGGSQPLWNEDHTRAVIFNGEIYNFRELGQELAAHGHEIRTCSDTEVIVHAYEAWGHDCVDHLRGMFAFAVFELPEGERGLVTQIFLARDPLGIKPLYYAAAQRSFLFASETRALLASGLIAPRLCETGVSSYLLFGSVVEPETLADPIRSLPPGHSLTLQVSDERLSPEIQAYWKPACARAGTERSRTAGEASPARRLRELLERAVRSHLVADVPLGVFLSSGLDSTALAALARREKENLRTFTVVFPEKEFSEADLAVRVAQQLGTQHQELALSGEEMLARLDDAVGALDQPSMDGINTYFVSWAARQAGLKVALSGLGSDELFGGYPSFRATTRVMRLAGLARSFPAVVRPALAALVERAARAQLERDAARKVATVCRDPETLPHPYFFNRLLFPPLVKNRQMCPEESILPPWREWLTEAAGFATTMDIFTAVSWLELRSYMVQTLLRDTDAMSMRHSLEVRVPFLDRDLVEYVLALPEKEKNRCGQAKGLLVEALGDLLPLDIRTQRKRTFTLPWQNWLRKPLRGKIAAGLEDWSPALESVFNRAQAQNVWQNFQRGSTSWSRPWALYVLNEWAKKNLRSRNAALEPASPKAQ